MLLLSIFAGGMIGTAARYGLSGWVYGRLGSGFPWGTLAVNITGAFALGLMVPLLDLQVPITSLRGFLTVGCIGAFTTFSTFAYETVMLAQRGERSRAVGYAAASVGLGVLSLAAGISLAQRLL